MQATSRSPWREALSAKERRELLQLDSFRSALSFAINWAIIFASMALVVVAPAGLMTFIACLAAIALIGARQLGLMILMHEGAHYSLFEHREWSDRITNWFAAYPLWSEVDVYRRGHLAHHARTGTAEDPDLGLVLPFPITRASFRRKAFRDLTGQTGIAQVRLIHFGTTGVRGMAPVLITNALLIAFLSALGHPEVYLLWPIAWMTTYRFCMRVRSIAEHAMVPDQGDMLRNTRTTLASFWERLLIAPNRVNYHLEHHVMVAVPHYNLPRMHTLLFERGAIDPECVAHGYASVLRSATSKPE